MKNSKKILTLNRETVQALEKASLQKAMGGLQQQQEDLVMIISCFCSADCP